MLHNYKMQRKSHLIKKSKLKLSSLKRKCWAHFSEWTRRKFADLNGFVKCVTCKKTFHWKALQAGHFIAGRGNSILFDERGTNPQCYSCNVHKHGDWPNYYDFMKEKYGEEVILELKRISIIPTKLSQEELLKKINKYKELNSILSKKNS